MSESSVSRFFASHKAAIAITAVVGVGSVAGLFYLYQQQNSTSTSTGSNGDSHKKKNKKKKKHSSNSDNNINSTLANAIFPVNKETGLPEIDESVVEKLSNEEKEKWALALKEAGNELFKQKKFEDAIEYYSKALLCKIDPVYYANRSACYSALEDNEKAIEDTTKALEINPSYSKCLLRRANAYENIEEYEKALFDLCALTIYSNDFSDKSKEAILKRVLNKQATKINEEKYLNLPKELPSTSSLSSVFGTFSEETIDLDAEYEEGSGAKFLIEGIKNVKLDKTEAYEKADVLFNQAVDRYSSLSLDELSDDDKKLAAMAYEYAATLLFLKNETKIAQEYITKSIELHPRPRAEVISALVLIDQGDIESALDIFGKAIANYPNDKDIYYQYGQIFYLLGDYPNAKENFNKAKELNPKNVFAYIQLACIAFAEQKENCESLFAEAKSLFPLSAEIPNYYGEILFHREDYEAASKQFDIAIRLQDVSGKFGIGALPLINKAMILFQQQKLPESVELLEKAIELDPKSEVAKAKLGELYLALQKPEDAIRLLEEACLLIRSPKERIETITLIENARIQIKIRNDKNLSLKLQEILQAQMASGAIPGI